MHSLFTYAIVDGICTDMFAVRIVIDVCLNPEDQDHNGMNFGFSLESDRCTFIEEWRCDQELDSFVNQLEKLVSNGENVSHAVSNDCDGEICFSSAGDFIKCSVQLDHFIALNSSLSLKEIGTPKDEFIRFVESLRQLIIDRNSVYKQCGFLLNEQDTAPNS